MSNNQAALDAIEKLKPCPFCGGEAEVRQGRHVIESTTYQCTWCGCQLETSETWQVPRAWNTRPNPLPPPTGKCFMYGKETEELM